MLIEFFSFLFITISWSLLQRSTVLGINNQMMNISNACHLGHIIQYNTVRRIFSFHSTNILISYSLQKLTTLILLNNTLDDDKICHLANALKFNKVTPNVAKCISDQYFLSYTDTCQTESSMQLYSRCRSRRPRTCTTTQYSRRNLLHLST